MKRKVTMNDIAKLLGISKNAVSQALSGKDGVSEDTRQRIIEVADKLGYVYKKSKPKNSKKIALIASETTFSLDFFGSIYVSAQSELNSLNMELNIISISDEDIKNNTIPQGIHEADGIFILSHIEDNYIKSIVELNIPCVLIDHHIPNLKADCVLINNRFGAFSAVNHLIELNHTNIGFLGDINYSPSYYERLDGYKLALYKNNLSICDDYIFSNVPNDIEIIKEIIKSFNESLPKAWFCANDKLGCLLLNALREFNYDVPRDVSICSFDNAEFSNLMIPKITSVDIRTEYLGKRAVDILLWRLSNLEDMHQEVLINTELIIKESTQSLL